MKARTEFKFMMAGFALMALFGLTGCSTFLTKYEKVTVTTLDVANKPKVVENLDVSVWRGKVLAEETLDGMNMEYGPVKLGLGAYSLKGDAATTKVLTDGVVAGIMAYFTGGASAVVPAVAKIVPADKVQPVSDAVLKAVKDPSATAPVPEPAVEEDESAPPPVPIVSKVEPKDVAAGKYAVVVLGNRKSCPLCRALWKPGFEADVEKSLPNADVIDADMTDAPALYKKYYPTEKWVYPYVIVFTPSGERIGAFTARGAARDNFVGEVEKLCPGCKP